MEAIEGMFIACLALIILSNITFVGLKYKFGRDAKRHQEKVRKTRVYKEKTAIKESIA